MISKELLSEVMNIKIEDIIDWKIFGKELKYYEKSLLGFCCDNRLSKHKDSICKSINVNELAHKCKEWAFIKNNYNIASFVGSDGISCIIRHNFPLTKDIKFYANTEHESIFKACQWILDNKSGSSE